MTTKKKPVAKKPVAKRPFQEVRDEALDHTPDLRAEEVIASEQEKILKSVSGISVDQTVQKLTQTNLDLGRTMSEIQQKVIEQAAELRNLDEAIRIKREQLQDLYDKEAVLETTRALVLEHEQVVQRLEDQKAALIAAFEELKQEQEKERKREQTDYAYNRDQHRRRIADDEAAEDRRRRAANAEQQQQLEKGWREREDALKAKEQEIEKLRQEVAEFPARLKAEAAKEVAIATSSLKKDLTHEHALKTAEMASQLQISQQNLANAQRQLQAQESEVGRLRIDLKAAQDQVVNVANSAFQSVSGQRAMDAVKEMAASQSQPRPKA